MVLQCNLQALPIKSQTSKGNAENRKNYGGIGRAILQMPGKLSSALALICKKGRPERSHLKTLQNVIFYDLVIFKSRVLGKF